MDPGGLPRFLHQIMCVIGIGYCFEYMRRRQVLQVRSHIACVGHDVCILLSFIHTYLCQPGLLRNWWQFYSTRWQLVFIHAQSMLQLGALKIGRHPGDTKI